MVNLYGDCDGLLIVREKVELVAARKLLSPACETVSVVTPALTGVMRLPDTVATVVFDELIVAGKAELLKY